MSVMMCVALYCIVLYSTVQLVLFLSYRLVSPKVFTVPYALLSAFTLPIPLLTLLPPSSFHPFLPSPPLLLIFLLSPPLPSSPFPLDGDVLPVLKGSTDSFLVGNMPLNRMSIRFPALELVAGAGK
jgi:hypothetical protein